ncbi:MAG: Cys-tRNA(Pro) deacylase [Oscillospiraceae bacterium]|nr:Cys-tRNA(Pro) deacylase [Oscillospiraceae bacterium]MDY6208473.1 Cys-tRNA(Pro) deacylase [Oscillospiraceae bacterium]
MAETKTNAMRILDRAKIKYEVHTYPHNEGEAVDGENVARLTGQDPVKVYKTLVTRGASNPSRSFYVFVIPVQKELDLKKAAKAVGEKSVEMIHVKEINGITGYIRGGCSPIGMKKQFTTVFYKDVTSLDTVIFSGGKIGLQIEASPSDIIGLIGAKTEDICF